MLNVQSISRVRYINLLIPTSTDPLITPYTKQLNHKILPLKRQYSILSNLKQSQTVKSIKIQLNKKDYQKINRSFQSLKRLRKTSPQFLFISTEAQIQKQKQQNYKRSDIKYQRLIQIRKSMIKKKIQKQKIQQKNQMKRSQTVNKLTGKQRNFDFLALTQPNAQQLNESKISNFTFFNNKNKDKKNGIANRNKNRKQTQQTQPASARYQNYLQSYILQRKQPQNSVKIKMN